MREKARSEHMIHRIFPQLNPLKTTEVTVLANELITARRSSNTWALVKPISYPAASERVDSLIHALATMEWQTPPLTSELLKDRPSAQEEFGFAPPRFSITIEEGKSVYRLMVGTNSAMGDQIYIQVVGTETIYRVSSELLKYIPTNKDQWRDTRLVNLSELPFEQIKVHSGAKSFEFQREPQGLWRLKTLQSRADATKVENLLKQLQEIRVLSFMPELAQNDLESYGLHTSPQTPELEISFLKNTNVLFELHTGISPTNHPDQVYAQRLTNGNIVIVPKEPFRAWLVANTNFVDRHMVSALSPEIHTIEVHGKEPFAITQSTNGGWTVCTTNLFPADAQLMKGLIEVFTNFEVTIEQPVVADFGTYGFVPPALQYTLRSSAGKSNIIAQLEFGSFQNGKVYERRTDEPSLNSIPSNLYERLPQAAWQLRDRGIWNFASNDVVNITVRQKGSIRKYVRDPDWNWTFAPGSHGSINSFSLDETLYRLGQLRAIYWSGVGDKDLDRFGFKETAHQIILTVRRGTNQTETLTIDFGKPSPYLHPYATIVRGGERLIFEFPVDLYSNGIQADLTIPPALRQSHKE